MTEIPDDIMKAAREAVRPLEEKHMRGFGDEEIAIVARAILAERGKRLAEAVSICEEIGAPCCTHDDWTLEQSAFFDEGQRQATSYLAMRFRQIIKRMGEKRNEQRC